MNYEKQIEKWKRINYIMMRKGSARKNPPLFLFQDLGFCRYRQGKECRIQLEEGK